VSGRALETGGACETGKLAAAKAAVELVKDGMLLGLGSGSTVRVFIDLLAERVRRENLSLVFCSTSLDTSFYAASKGLREVPLGEDPPDLAVDGADLVLPDRTLIKGGGAAHFREKIIDYFSREFVVIVDETKVAETAPSSVSVPLEVHPMAVRQVVRRLRELAEVRGVQVRASSGGKLGPVVTDNGNLVLDVVLEGVEDWQEEEVRMKLIPGVLESGIFALRKPDKILIGTGSGTTLFI